MSLVTATHTLPQVEGIKKSELLRKIANETGLGQYGVATSGSTTVIGDTSRLKSTQFNTKEWVGGWAQIIQADAAVPEGEHSPITTYDPTHASDHITVNPALTAAVAAGDEYILWKNPSPSVISDLIDQCLTDDLYMPCWTILTEVPDGDMEQNNTTDWNTASNATSSKCTIDSSGADGIPMSGKRWLKVTLTSATGYVENTFMRVRPSQQYHLSAMVRGTQDSAELCLWDATNDVLIKEFTDGGGQHTVRIGGTVQIPSDCNAVTIRLSASSNNGSQYWDDVCFYATSSQDIKAPWWVKQKNQILGVLQLRTKNISTTSPDVWDSALMGEPDYGWYPVDDALGGGGLRMHHRHSQIGIKPVFMLGIRNEEAYANINTEKKYIDPNLFMACVNYRLANYMTSPGRTGGNTSKDWKERAVLYSNQYTRLLNQQMESLKRTLTPADTWVKVTDSMAGIRY